MRRKLHLANLVALHVRNAVVVRQPLVQEGIVAADELDDIAVVSEDVVEVAAHLALQGNTRLVIPISVEIPD